jgi:hypothetical protein
VVSTYIKEELGLHNLNFDCSALSVFSKKEHVPTWAHLQVLMQ